MRARRAWRALVISAVLGGVVVSQGSAQAAAEALPVRPTAGTGPATGTMASNAPIQIPAQSGDSFSHRRHQQLACLTCHLSNSGSLLTFEPPRGCQLCHHSEQAQKDCVQCHDPGSVPATLAVSLAIAAAGKPPLERTVAFPHQHHTELGCKGCHGQPVTLAPTDSAQTCRACHVEHHEDGRDCAACHRTPAITQPHARPVQAHVACDACHATAAIVPLIPTRSFCLACHDPEVDHHPARECVACHLQSTPEEYRSHLLR